MSKISELTDGGSLLPTDHLIAVRSGANVKVKADTINVDQIDLGDNEKIRLGNSQDLEIYHNAIDSIINDNGTGSLKLQQGGSTKLEVTTTGIDVTGSVVSDGLTVNSGATSTTVNFQNSGTAYSTLYNDINGVVIFSADAGNTGAAPRMQFNVGGQQAFRITDGNDISFYDTDGTTASFVYDASAGLTINEAGADRDFRVESDGASHMLFVDAGNNRVGIGEASPDTPLHLTTSSSGTAVTIESTDGSSAAGSTVILYKNSASPLASDGLSTIKFRGNDSGGATNDYVQLVATLEDPTATAEDGSFTIQALTNGANRNRLTVNSTGININESGQDLDFRVESDSQSHMLFVDAGNGVVGIKNDSPASAATHLSIGGDTISTTKAMVSMVDSNPSLHMRGGSPLIYFDVTGGGIGTICTDGTAMYIKDGTIDARGNTTHVFGSSTSGSTVINESSQDIDFRVESDNNANAIFMNAGTGITTFGHGNTMTGNTYNFQAAALNGFAVGSSNAVYGTVNQGGQDGDLLLVSNAYPANLGASRNVIILGGTSGGSSPKETARFNPEEGAIFNEQSIAAHDFRVESDTNTHMLFVDAGLNRLGIGTSGPTGSVHLKDITDSDGSDVFYVAQNTTSNRIGGYKVLDESGTVSLKMQYDNGGNNASIINPNNGSLAVYLGGTAAANALDDYEEGTWTAGINYGSVGGTAATLSESGGSYVKIGRMVTVNFEADVSNTNSGAGNVYITGLPFTIDDIITPTGLEANGTIAYFTGFASGVNSLSLGADTAGGLALFGQTSSTQTAISSITAAAMGTGEIRGSITYFTT